MEVSDNGYDGEGGVRTASFTIQGAVRAVNDAPVAGTPPPWNAVPGERQALPGMLVIDPDTDTDGKLSAGMLKVRVLRPTQSSQYAL